MTGLRIIFDRERMALGWMNSDCKWKTKPIIRIQARYDLYHKFAFFLLGGNSTDTTPAGANTPLLPASRPPSSGSVKHKTAATRSLFAFFLILTTTSVLLSSPFNWAYRNWYKLIGGDMVYMYTFLVSLARHTIGCNCFLQLHEFC